MGIRRHRTLAEPWGVLRSRCDPLFLLCLFLRHISLTLPATFRGRNSTRADYEYQHSNLYAISGRQGPPPGPPHPHPANGRRPRLRPGHRRPPCASWPRVASALPLLWSLQGACSHRGPASPSLCVPAALREGPRTQRVLKLMMKNNVWISQA